MTDPMTRVRSGLLRGQWANDMAVFRGIPFAGLDDSLGAPRRAASWDGTLDAQTFGPSPPQAGIPGAGSDRVGSADDWLTLNVWTPDRASSLPVMVWIQGGGYLFGTSGLPEYDGARLAHDGVVVVTFNYRVGIEGFAQVEGAPANRGLLDQVAALEWVRDNIAAFGGDPDRVTVFGQSAGGGSVAALLAMPRAAGLFDRAVVQSMPSVFLTPALATDIASALDAESSVDTLLADIGRYAERWGLAAHGQVPLAPVVDGSVLPQDPWRALADGAASEVDLLVGHTRHEQRLLSLMNGVLGQVSEEQAATALRLFAPGATGADRYRASGSGPDGLHDEVHSDWLFRMPSLHLAEAHTGTTHLYELTWPAPGMGGLLGACHGLDVPLVFGNLTSGQPAMLLADDLAEAEHVSAQMRTAWTSFAIHGDPGWPAYESVQRLTRVFDVEASVRPYPEEASRRIWLDHTFAALPLLHEHHGA